MRVRNWQNTFCSGFNSAASIQPCPKSFLQTHTGTPALGTQMQTGSVRVFSHVGHGERQAPW